MTQNIVTQAQGKTGGIPLALKTEVLVKPPPVLNIAGRSAAQCQKCKYNVKYKHHQ